MQTSDYVEIKEARGAGRWSWTGRKGHIVKSDQYCYTVRADDGETIRDVRDHFRAAAS